MKNSIIISATSSNQGKTLLTMALLYHYRDSARAFKIGPDYIDPQFHEYISNNPSINLDKFMMSEEQIKWIFDKYSNKKLSILEGVMGFYDGLDRGASTYEIAKLLKIPTILILDASGTYITLLAIIKGMRKFREENQIKAVVLNRVSSKSHYELIKKYIEEEFSDIVVLGWIKKELETIASIHLGLDLKELKLKDIEKISNEVLENLNLELIEKMSAHKSQKVDNYPFEKIEKVDKILAIVKDENFSFIYHDNIEFLKETFKEVKFISAINDEEITSDIDIVYICGGYVETEEAYSKLKNSINFKESLKKHSKTKRVYAECAGMIYLSKSIDDKEMANILAIEFEMQNKRVRLGYYYGYDIDKNLSFKGHAFHYSKPKTYQNEFMKLSKKDNKSGYFGGFKKDKIVGVYLHTMFRSEVNIIREYF